MVFKLPNTSNMSTNNFFDIEGTSIDQKREEHTLATFLALATAISAVALINLHCKSLLCKILNLWYSSSYIGDTFLCLKYFKTLAAPPPPLPPPPLAFADNSGPLGLMDSQEMACPATAPTPKAPSCLMTRLQHYYQV